MKTGDTGFCPVYKKCGGCNYEFDSLTIPKKSNQIIVKSYDELKAALAKGGKQWLSLIHI